MVSTPLCKDDAAMVAAKLFLISQGAVTFFSYVLSF